MMTTNDEKPSDHKTDSPQKSTEQLKADALKSIAMQKSNNKKESKTVTKPVKPANKVNNPKGSERTLQKTPQKTSKTAILALLLSLTAGAAVVGLYYWQEQQQIQFEQNFSREMTQTINQNNLRSIANSQSELKALLAKQQQQSSAEVNNVLALASKAQQEKFSQLQSQLKQITQRQPSDWLIHESEYLIRVALRSLWLEKDVTAAVGLLKDADQRLSQLNDPQYLPVRASINQDIEQLQLLPKLATDNTILALMGLNQQVHTLPFTKVEAIDSKTKEQAFKLSENTSEWRANLAKSWQKFLDNFITIRRRDGSVEALMSPKHQQNLRENLSLKLQLAQWAASQAKAQLFDKTLNDIQLWHQQYFDMDNPINQNFNQRIATLKTTIVAVDYPNTLASLNAIQNIVNNQQRKLLSPEKKAEKANDLKDKNDEKSKEVPITQDNGGAL